MSAGIHYKELAHVITEADTSQTCSRQARDQESQWGNSKSREKPCSSLKVVREKESLLQGVGEANLCSVQAVN